MDNNTSWTPSPEDNLLGLHDKDAINEAEAKGIAIAEVFIFGLDTEIEISTTLILDIHHKAFGELYDWGGNWRVTNITVGQIEPPKPNQVLQLMYQFVDNLNFKIKASKSQQDYIDCLLYAHYEFIRIHPFNNGNGRTGRMLMNLVAMKFGLQPLVLYHRTGDSRKIYINAMKAADNGDFENLANLIRAEFKSF